MAAPTVLKRSEPSRQLRLGCGKMIREGRLDRERLQRGRAVSERNAQVQVQLISDLLDALRIIAGKTELQLGLVEPVEVCRPAIDALRPQINEKQITLDDTLDDSTGRGGRDRSDQSGSVGPAERRVDRVAPAHD